MPTARLVDARGVDWYVVNDADRPMYRSGHLVLPRNQVQRRFGPTRPVEPPTADSAALLSATLYRLTDCPSQRHLLTGSLCVALDDAGQYAGRTCPLTAGHPGSAESQAVTTMAYVVGPDLARDRDRFDNLARHVVAAIVLDWVTGADRYVVVGGTLAALLGPPVARAGGWDAVADHQLRAGPYADQLSWYVTSRAGVPA